RPDIGRGIAYHTGNSDHLLNVRVANMSALPDDPDHFWRWLSARATQPPLCPDPFCLVPRRIHGDYIASPLAPFPRTPDASAPPRLAIVQGECVALNESACGVEAALAGGARHAGDIAILATGHDAVLPALACHANPWSPPSTALIDKDATVLLLGTGLTMVDY
ncbi:hypothetical protein CEE86_14130, partial [Lactobacillus crispatus]